MSFVPCVHFAWEFGVAGAVGGLVYVLIQPSGLLVFPSLTQQRGDKALALGSLRFIVVGAIAGCVGDKCPTNAFMWGIAGMAILQWLFDRVVERVIKGGK